MKNELIDAGIDRKTASEMSRAYGIGASILESIFPAGKVGKIFGPQANNIVQSTYRQSLREIGKEMGKDFIKE